MLQCTIEYYGSIICGLLRNVITFLCSYHYLVVHEETFSGVRAVCSPLSVIFSSDLQGAVRPQEVVWVSVVFSFSVLVKLAGDFKVPGEIKDLPDIIQIVVDTN